MINYKSGNLLEDPAYALVNTVNTVGVMGKGIALQFRKAFPYNFEYYKHCCKTGTCKIGYLICVEETSLLYGTKLIVNFPTKTHWRKPSEYSYIEAGVIALAQSIRQYAIPSIALPPLGCGNGGLDWAIVRPMIERHLSNLNANLTIYEPIIHQTK